MELLKSIDWEEWEKSSLSSMLEQMSKTYHPPNTMEKWM